jgi:murein DD-endopeptidase MepM/ murein hydrolase activator NlpD
MPAWLAKLALQIAADPEKAVKWLFIGIMMIFSLLVIICAPVLLLMMPFASAEQANNYKAASDQIYASTTMNVTYQEMLAIDAVLKEQDFSDSKTSTIVSFFQELFVWKEEKTVTTTCPKTNEHGIVKDVHGNIIYIPCTKKETVYHKRSMEDVMIRLGLNEDQKEQVRTYMLADMDALFDEDDNGGDINDDEGQLGDIDPINHDFFWPVYLHKLSSKFGPRVDPITGRQQSFHKGLDIPVPVGTEVKAAMSGKVVSAGFSDEAGNVVRISHANGYSTRYLHLSAFKVRVGDVVKQGDVIALSGNTGKRTTGAHLHFEILMDGKQVDPLPFFQ